MNIWKRYSMRVSKNWVKFNKMFTLSPCLLPHGDHLHHQRGKQAAATSGAQQALAPLDTGGCGTHPSVLAGPYHGRGPAAPVLRGVG